MAQRMIYTQAMIQQWRLEKVTLREELAKLQNQLAISENEIEQFARHINKIHQNDIQPRQVEIKKILARIRTIELPKFIDDCKASQADLENQKNLQQQRIAALLQNTQALNTTIATLHACIELETLRSEKIPSLTKNIIEMEWEIQLLNQKIERAAKEIAHLQTQGCVAANNVIRLTDQKRKSTDFKAFYQSQTTIFEEEWDHSLSLQKKLLESCEADLSEAQNRAKDHENNHCKITATLKQLQEKLSLIQVQIAGHPAQAFQSTATLAELKEQLSHAKHELLLTEQQQSHIQNTIQNCDDDIVAQGLKILVNQSFLEQSLALAKDYQHENNLEKLFDAKNAVFCVLAHFQLAITDKQAKIQQHDKTIQEINHQIAVRSNRQIILQADPFLSTYENNPHTLYNDLTQLLHQTLYAFEDEYANEQSEEERLALFDIHCKLNLFKLENNADALIWQLRLQQLYGLIICVRNRLNLAMPLATYLNEVLKSVPLDASEALNEYDRLQQESPAFIPKNRADLAAKELQDYATACAQFTQTLNQLPVHSHAGLVNLKASGFTLLKTIQHQKEKLRNEFNLKFTTTLLTTANQLASPATDANVRQRFIKLISKVDTGKPSLTKKIVGAALVFLGAAILAVSIGAKILSLGVAAPVTVLGMCIGVKTVLGGVGLFSSGMQRGLLRALTQYYDSQDYNPSVQSSSTANFTHSLQKPEASSLPTHTKAVC